MFEAMYEQERIRVQKNQEAMGKLSARAEQSRSEAKSAWPNVLSGAKKSTFTAPHVENMKPERDCAWK